MILEAMITSIAGNLGDRAGGSIGSESTEAVVLRGVNIGLYQCTKLSNPTAYEKNTIIEMSASGGQEYILPLIDEMRIKDILVSHFVRAAENTPLNICRVSWPAYVQVVPAYKQGLSGVPSHWSLNGTTLYIDRIPESDYNMYLYCEVFPKSLLMTEASIAMPVGIEWELAVEAYATYYCYLKLQQTQDAQYWKLLYDEQKSLNTQVKRKVNNREQGVQSGGFHTGNAHLNPFIRTNRI